MSSSSKEPDDIGQAHSSENVSEEPKREKKPKEKKIKKRGSATKTKRCKDKKPEKKTKLAAPVQEPEKVPSAESDDEKPLSKLADITPPIPPETENVTVEVEQPVCPPKPFEIDIPYRETPPGAALQSVETPASAPVLGEAEIADVRNVCEVVYDSEAEKKAEEAPPLAETKDPAPEVKKPE